MKMFDFAGPPEILKAVKLFVGSHYGSMLWDLFGEEAGKFFRCWNTCTKLCWNLPRNTSVYFVENLLSCGIPSIRQQVLTRYVKFYRSLRDSPSKEVAVISRIVGTNASSNTGRNMLNITLESN